MKMHRQVDRMETLDYMQEERFVSQFSTALRRKYYNDQVQAGAAQRYAGVEESNLLFHKLDQQSTEINLVYIVVFYLFLSI